MSAMNSTAAANVCLNRLVNYDFIASSNPPNWRLQCNGYCEMESLVDTRMDF